MEFKKYIDNQTDNKLILELSKTFNLNEKIIEILINRGVDTKEKIEAFLHNDLKHLKSPYLLLNMDKVVDRIEKAIKNNEKILIFGDYDVDGICAVSILYLFLKTKTQNVITYLPNRFEDGYGLSCPCIDKIAQQEKPDLIITVDCGISCKTEVDYIKKMGVDIIVTDHHELPEELPNCLTVNTKFDQDFNFKGLSGAGVAFKIVQALSTNFGENFERFLSICAISTIADIVPLVDENRIIVKEGLKRLNLLPLGVKLLLKHTFNKIDKITSTDIAFKIAPIINSAGRLDDANIALKLFISNSLNEIQKALLKLENLNNTRKDLCGSIYLDCVNIIKNENKNDMAIVLYNESWDIGVLGIVCARICEEYNKPTILLGKCSGELRGSGRSVGSVDIFKLFNACSKHLNKFGGHTKAGGLSLNEENFNSFKLAVNSFIAENYTENDFVVIKNYDLDLKTEEITLDFCKQLEILQPFGYENNAPVFCVDFKILKVSKMKNFDSHLMLETENKLNLISFNDKNYENYLNFQNKKMLIELQINKYKGQENLKAIVKNVKFSNPNKVLSSKLLANKMSTLSFDNNKQVVVKKYTSITQVLNLDCDKTLFLSYNVNDEKIKHFENFNICSFNYNKSYAEKTLMYGIDCFENLNKFNKIVLLETPISQDFVATLKENTNAEIYIPQKETTFELKLNVSREEFLEVYYVLIKAINKNLQTNDFYSYFEKLVLNFNFKHNYLTFFLATKVFEELKLIERKKLENKLVSFKLNKIKTDLENSKLFKKLLKFNQM